jgi:hypothetical protein
MRPTDLPGTRLLAGARRWFDHDTVATVFEPLVADWQHEWLLESNEESRRRTHRRATRAFWSSAIRCLPRLIAPGAPRESELAATTTLLVFLTGGMLLWFLTLALRLPFYGALQWLAPAMLLVSFPFSCLPVGLVLRRSHNRRPIAKGVWLSLGLTIAFFAVGLGWIGPAANQRWRTELFQALNTAAERRIPIIPARGPRELTITELWRSEMTRDTTVCSPCSATEVNFEWHNRLMLLSLPFVLFALGWTLATVSRDGAAGPVAFWFAASAVSIVLSEITREASGRAAFYAWPPVIAYVVVTCGLAWRTRSNPRPSDGLS